MYVCTLKVSKTGKVPEEHSEYSSWCFQTKMSKASTLRNGCSRGRRAGDQALRALKPQQAAWEGLNE